MARSRASEVFEAARRLFEAGDFSAAAQSFEEAYALAPHHSASWNAARSWHKAGDLPHAAMLYQRYLREAPWDAPDRDEAGRSLTEIRPSLGRIQIVPPGTTGVTVDGRPLEYDEIWVVPGAHLVESSEAGRPTVTKVDVVAGAIVSVAIAPLTALVAASADPQDYEMLGLCQFRTGDHETAATSFRAGLDRERAVSPESDLCGRLMKHLSAT